MYNHLLVIWETYDETLVTPNPLLDSVPIGTPFFSPTPTPEPKPNHDGSFGLH